MSAPPAGTSPAQTASLRAAIEQAVRRHRNDREGAIEAVRQEVEEVSHRQLLEFLVDLVTHSAQLTEDLRTLEGQHAALWEQQQQQHRAATTATTRSLLSTSSLMPPPEHLGPSFLTPTTSGVKKIPATAGSSSYLAGHQSASTLRSTSAGPLDIDDNGASSPPPSRVVASPPHPTRCDSVRSAMETSEEIDVGTTHSSSSAPTLRRFPTAPRPPRGVKIMEMPTVLNTDDQPPESRTSSSIFNDSNVTFNTSASVVKRGETLDSVNNLDFMRPIGSGAQATVWLCVDVTTAEERAVKVIDRSEWTDTQCAVAEIQAATRLHHDNIISLYEVIDDPTAQALFLVMEYVEHGASGCVDGDTGECDTSLTLSQIADLASGAAQGLQYCHARGVVHGDIKPENVLVAKDDETDHGAIRAVLADFGVSKVCETNLRNSLLLGEGERPCAVESHDGSQRRSSPMAPFAQSSEGTSMSASQIDSRLPPELFKITSKSRWSTQRSSPSGSTEQVLSTSHEKRVKASGVEVKNRRVSFVISPDSFATSANEPAAPVASPVNRNSNVVLTVGRPRRYSVMFVAEEEIVLPPPQQPPEDANPMVLPPAVYTVVSPPTPTPPSGAASPAGLSGSANLIKMPSFKQVRHVLADKTREVTRRQSEDLRAHFAKRGPKTVGGTPAFQAPELLEGGEPTPASDMWALGVTLYALLFKQLPWNGSSWFELREAVCTTPVHFPASTITDREHRRWRGIIERLLDKDPKTRMTASELVHRSTRETSPP